MKAKLIYQAPKDKLIIISAKLLSEIGKNYRDEFEKGIIKVYSTKDGKLILEVSGDRDFIKDFVKGFKKPRTQVERMMARASGIKIDLKTEGMK